MAYVKREFSFKSSNGSSDIYAEVCRPEGDPVGVIVISHGMIDHVGRYEFVKEFFTSRGFVVAGNDHIGHGRSVKDPSDFGYLGKDGASHIVDDLHSTVLTLRREYAGKKTFMLGHSMGSFMARMYVERYPEGVDGVIIHGTGGPNPILPLGRTVVGLVGLFKGDAHRSELIRSLAFGSYNNRFDPSEGADAWLTSLPSLVEDRKTDPYTAFTFTVSGYRELFAALGESNSASHFAAFPKKLPTLIVSGEDDPVGDFGKGVRKVYGLYRKAGVENVVLKLYPKARHELFNEREREGYYSDIYEWCMGGVSDK